jgi:hypothetical protein
MGRTELGDGGLEWQGRLWLTGDNDAAAAAHRGGDDVVLGWAPTGRHSSELGRQEGAGRNGASG